MTILVLFLIPALSGCIAPDSRTIQLVDAFDAATDSYATCLPMHVVDTGKERLFFRYSLDGDYYPVLETMVCAGIVLPSSGALQVSIQPLERPLDDDLADRIFKAQEQLSERIMQKQHPDPLEVFLIPNEYGAPPLRCVFMK
jgi:hypothetical protein